MFIAVRKEPEGYIYIDKTFLERFGKEQLEEYGYTLVEVDDKYFDCEASDFNDDLTFNVEKYNLRHQTNENDIKIAKLTQKLVETDYIAYKLAEANSRYIVTEDKSEIIELQTKYFLQLVNREKWRKEIDELKKQIKGE